MNIPWSLSNADILAAFPKLANHYERGIGIGTSIIKCDRLRDLNLNKMVGSKLCVLTGDNHGLDNIIDSYDSQDGKMTFNQGFPNSLENNVTFGIVYKDFDVYVHRAYDVMKDEFRNSGIDINLFLTHSQLKELHLTKTITLICFNKRQGISDDDLYHASFELFNDKYERDFEHLIADYDADGDGLIKGYCSDANYLNRADCVAASMNTWILGTCSDGNHNNEVDCINTFNGYCSDTQYVNKTTCELNNENWTDNTWTPAHCSNAAFTDEANCLAVRAIWNSSEAIPPRTIFLLS